MNITNSVVELNNEEKQYMENYVLSGFFPWYLSPKMNQSTSVPTEMNASDTHFLFHHMKMRSAVEGQDGQVIDMEVFNFFTNIFDKWCKSNSISWSKIHRATLNLTFSVPAEHGIPHLDHKFPHKNWIMYLDTVPDTDTILFDDNYNIVKSIPCEKYTAVSFDSQLHSTKYKPGLYYRRVAVFTYS